MLHDLDSAGRGKEGGGRRDEEEGGKRRVKNEKVVKKMKKDASLTLLGLVSLTDG